MSRRILFLILIASIFVNFLAVFGPEFGFDALWYHLTIRKIYLMWGKIDFIPGGLMYYSAMPRLGEFLYLGAMRVMGAGEVGPHLINWVAGIGAAFLTFKIARKHLDEKYSLLTSVIFYVTPLVGWQSGSAYVDLIRTFFEVLAFWFFLKKKPVAAGVALGLAVGTKTLALGSLGIFGILGLVVWRDWRKTARMILMAALVSYPWFAWAYLKTGFPFYPLGAGILDASHNFGNWGDLGNWKNMVSPVYLMILPWFFKSRVPKEVFWYIMVSFFVWLLIPHTGEGRFILPYLPVWAVGAGWTISHMQPMGFMKLMVGLTMVIAVAVVGYRFAANLKVVPYLLGKQTKTEYLCQHLDFSTRVFVDCDGTWGERVKPTELVLVKGFHNLYYIKFPFVHETWYKGEKVDYVLEYKQ